MSETTFVYGNDMLACATGLIDLTVPANAERIAECFDSCIGIKDPKTTVSELVVVCKGLLDLMNTAYASSSVMAARARAVLAKTGGVT